MPRTFLIVLDSFGIGGAPDAVEFGDEGADTFGHIAAECAAGRADEGRSGPLHLPNLAALGIGHAAELATGHRPAGFDAEPRGLYGAATELSKGKDTPSGHWELAGVPVPWDWHTFSDCTDSFPPDLIAEVCRHAGTDGILGNRHAPGTAIIEEEGEAHLHSGWPICYTSIDSVFQIAAHEEAFGLERLLDLCRALAPTLHGMRVGRVIARPFVGAPGDFRRTQNRRDFAIAPPAPTLCDMVHREGRQVNAVGKIGDIFSMRGIDTVCKGSDAELLDCLAEHVRTADDGALTFANFVEFDSLYGHRRDVAGYARHLEWFDAGLPRLTRAMRDGDLMVITADHGNDPTWHGTDHTRERVPVLVHGAGSGAIGHCAFVDVAASVAAHLGLPPPGGRSFL